MMRKMNPNLKEKQLKMNSYKDENGSAGDHGTPRLPDDCEKGKRSAVQMLSS